ncbi:unnamed protein product [Leuciscus chuanchicus]
MKVFELRAAVKTLEKECIEEVMFFPLIISCQQPVLRSHRQILCHSANECSCHVSYRGSVTEEDPHPHPHHTDPHSICCRTPRRSAHHDLLLYSAVKMLSAVSRHLILYKHSTDTNAQQTQVRNTHCAPALTLMPSKHRSETHTLCTSTDTNAQQTQVRNTHTVHQH